MTTLNISASTEGEFSKMDVRDSEGTPLLSISYKVEDRNAVLHKCVSRDGALPEDVSRALVNCLARIEAQLGGVVDRVLIEEEGMGIPSKSLFDCGFRLSKGNYCWVNPIHYI